MILSFIWMVAAIYLFGYAFTGEHGTRSWLFGFPPLVVALVLMSTLSIPMHWLPVLGIGAAAAAARYLKLGKKNERRRKMAPQAAGYPTQFGNEKSELSEFEITKQDAAGALAAAFMFALLFYGATQYPYLEDDDPWLHALGVSQVAHTLSGQRPVAPSAAEFERWYLEPYPPAFDLLLGVLRELNDSTLLTLKLFNALLAGIAVLAFYFWMKDAFPKEEWLAPAAAALVAIIPGFMSHFIWAQTLAILLMFVSFMAFSRLERERGFLPQAAVCVAAVLVTQPTVALTFGLIGGMLLFVHLAGKNFGFSKLLFLALAGGLAVSLIIFWAPAYLKFGKEQFLSGLGFEASYFQGGTSSDTSGGVIYTLEDFLFPPAASKIDQAIGIGLGVALPALFAVFLVAKGLRRGEYDATLLFFVAFLAFGFLGTEGNALPLKLFPHRFWVFLAIPAAALAACGLVEMKKRLARRGWTTAIVLFAFLLYFTSLAPRVAVQTATWPPGSSWSSQEEVAGYMGLLSLPTDTKVFPVCAHDSRIAGLDKLSEPWNAEYAAFKKAAFLKSPADAAAFLKPRGYQYLVLDASCLKNWSAESVQEKLGEYTASPLYESIASNGGFFLFRIR